MNEKQAMMIKPEIPETKVGIREFRLGHPPTISELFPTQRYPAPTLPNIHDLVLAKRDENGDLVEIPNSRVEQVSMDNPYDPYNHHPTASILIKVYPERFHRNPFI